MLSIKPKPLPAETEAALLVMQSRIDSLPTYAERVAAAKVVFSAQNRAQNATFGSIRKTLGDACGGAHRCMYCEDSAADQIDHFRPKSFYPELVFSWMNYLYACGACNLRKQHRFSVLSANTAAVVEIVRRRGDPVVEPEVGSSVLLDPRTDDPLEYLVLDLLGTFQFTPRYPKGTYAHVRAEYTIDVLKLNDRDWLLEARLEAYGSYRARLREYASARGSPRAQELIQALMRCGQPTVWAEMKRNSGVIRELKELFDEAPEARYWR